MEDSSASAAGNAMRARLAALRGQVSWQIGLVALVIVGLLVVAGDRALSWHHQRQQVSDEKDAAAAAANEVERLITISASTSKDDIEKLLDGATADFRTELEDQADRLRKALTQNKVTATGEVVSAGVVELEDGRATVIIAAEGTVKNQQSKDAEPRSYRLRVDLQRYGDRWLVSGLEFVA